MSLKEDRKVPALELPLEPLSQDLREPPEHQNLNLARTQSGGLLFTNSNHQTAFHGLEQWEHKHLFHYFNIQLAFLQSLGPLLLKRPFLGLGNPAVLNRRSRSSTILREINVSFAFRSSTI